MVTEHSRTLELVGDYAQKKSGSYLFQQKNAIRFLAMFTIVPATIVPGVSLQSQSQTRRRELPLKSAFRAPEGLSSPPAGVWCPNTAWLQGALLQGTAPLLFRRRNSGDSGFTLSIRGRSSSPKRAGFTLRFLVINTEETRWRARSRLFLQLIRHN